MKPELNENKSLIHEINQTARRYIVLAAPTQKIAEELLEWWNN